MASGKSTIGRALADEIGWPFVDTDEEIEARAGKRISEIFVELGERAFRDLESAVIRSHIAKVQMGQPRVLALGGGAFVQESNHKLLGNNGVSVWLDCPLELIHRRLGEDTTRPLAANRNGLGTLYEDRRPFYSRADYRVAIDTDDTPEIIRRIVALPMF